MTTAQPELILVGKSIFTGTGDTPAEGALAVAGGRILAVGKPEEILPLAGADTKVIDCGKGLILPGLHDDHVHLLSGCLYREYPNLGQAKSEEETAAAARAFYDENPGMLRAHPWALGFNWYNYWWQNQDFPTAATLDRYFPDTPVCLLNVDAHGVWVNTKALELCGVTSQTPDVPFGRIFRDENGEPTGFFQENALSLIVPKAFAFSPETEKQIFRRYLGYCAQCGVTSVNDMQPFFGLEMGSPAVLRALDEAGELPLRVNFATDLFAEAERTRQIAEAYPAGKVRHNGLKGFLDGVIVTHTSVMLADYTDDPTFDRHFPLSDFALVEKKVAEYHRLGYPIHLHATGDGAVRFALDCYEKAIARNGRTGSRLSIEHCDLVDDADFKRFGKLGVVASTQPPHIASADSYPHSLYRATIGETREKNLWAFRRMLEGGAVLGVGTDFPVVNIDPRQVIHSALERLFPDGTPRGGFNPGEKLTLAQTLKAYTCGGAYMCGLEQELGTLEPGKLADITVFDTDLFAVKNSEEVLTSEVVLTVCDGRIVYQKKED